MRFQVACLISLAVALFAVGCNLPAPEPTPTRAMVFIPDSSTSSTTDRCAELGADLATVLEGPAVVRLDIAVLALGDKTSGFEPKTIIAHDKYVAGGDLLEDPEAAQAARVGWIENVVAACDQRLRPTPVTPLFLAVKRGAEALRALCDSLARDRVVCAGRELRLHTDLRETVEPAIRDRIFARRRARDAVPAPLPKLELADAHVAVSVCGLSDTLVERGERTVEPDAPRRVWTEVLGAEPEIAPSCVALPRRKRVAKGTAP